MKLENIKNVPVSKDFTVANTIYSIPGSYEDLDYYIFLAGLFVYSFKKFHPNIPIFLTLVGEISLKDYERLKIIYQNNILISEYIQ